MTKTILSTLFISAILITGAVVASVDFTQFADAIKAKGSPGSPATKSYGSANNNIVCGDRLCSEVGGRTVMPSVPEEEEAEDEIEMQEEIAVEAEVGDEDEMEKEIELKEEIAIEEAETEDKTMEMKPHDWITATGTIQSMQDPGLGHESHQLAIMLPPSDKIYKGIVSYDVSEPIQLVALHGPLAEGEDTGQPIWTPDGETKFALTLVDPEASMGSWLFTGNALAVHTMNEEQFTVSYSVSYLEKEMSDTVITGTLNSMIDPAIGHEEHSLAIILPPSEMTYSGILTYAASEPIQLVVLHGPLAEGEDTGQMTWELDDDTKFGITFVDNESSMGTWVFAGNALAVHTMNPDGVTVSYSVVAGQN